jgi:hypothetical protein
VISELSDPELLALVVRAISVHPASQVLDLPDVRSTVKRVLGDDMQVRQHLARLLRVQGQVAILDQSDLSVPYRRYMAYEYDPQVRYGIGLYQSRNGIIVSVGENPWSKRGPVHLGQLCREFGGGGRYATAGIPTHSAESARELAAILAQRLNHSLESEKFRQGRGQEFNPGRIKRSHKVNTVILILDILVPESDFHFSAFSLTSFA